MAEWSLADSLVFFTSLAIGMYFLVESFASAHYMKIFWFLMASLFVWFSFMFYIIRQLYILRCALLEEKMDEEGDER